ncbi:mitochondrial cytochrome c oxidase subunit VIC-like protein [Leptotrombidium deliense]|uniref:Mitochondrial cytochrome c oxidase subunit VIC-like protein n=1 Tax=Leptotrombidium deliense TaxID=299467 RepID=A0A443SKJ8_9ACAR|nr:mitochondrial cytochrome c oxidase subunit VIC-like protein [Leptotrombidium deliense]
MAQLSKPNLRGFVAATLTRNLIMFGMLGVTGAVAYKYLVAIPRQQRYAEFYKTYDPVKAYERMEKAGLVRGFENELE